MFAAKVVWLRIPNWDDGTPRTDAKNPDPKKRSRPMIGLQLMSNLQAGDGFTGEIYNADSGKVYQVTIERQSAAELNVQGCMMKVLCGSQTWTKVPDVNQQAANSASGPKPAKSAAPPARTAIDPVGQAPNRKRAPCYRSALKSMPILDGGLG